MKRYKKHRFGKKFRHRIIFFYNGTIGMTLVKSANKKLTAIKACEIIMKRNGWEDMPIIDGVDVE